MLESNCEVIKQIKELTIVIILKVFIFNLDQQPYYQKFMAPYVPQVFKPLDSFNTVLDGKIQTAMEGKET